MQRSDRSVIEKEESIALNKGLILDNLILSRNTPSCNERLNMSLIIIDILSTNNLHTE